MTRTPQIPAHCPAFVTAHAREVARLRVLADWAYCLDAELEDRTVALEGSLVALDEHDELDELEAGSLPLGELVPLLSSGDETHVCDETIAAGHDDDRDFIDECYTDLAHIS